MPSLEKTSSQIRNAGPWPAVAQPGEGAVDLAADAGCGVGRSERGGAADPRHPRLERGRAELLGRERGGGRGGAVVGVLGDHGAAVAGHGPGDLDRDVVRLAARVDEHDDRELVGEQGREPVGVRRHLVDEVAGVRRQPSRLRGERRRHARVGVTHLRHVVVRVEQPVAVDVRQPDAVTRREPDGLVVAQRERRPEPRAAQGEALREADGRGRAGTPHASASDDGERRRIVLVEQRRASRSSRRRRRGCSRRCPGAARRARRR